MGGAPLGTGASQGNGGAPALQTLTLSNLQIEGNPKMPLGCFVSWTTAEPADSEVRFVGAEGALSVRDEAEVTEHKVYVLGMRAGVSYDLTAMSSNATSTGSAEGAFTAGALPNFVPEHATLVTAASDKTQPGFTLTNFWNGGGSPITALILDAEGYPVWYYVSGTANDQFGATSTDWTFDGTVLLGNAGNEPAREVDLEGNIIWEGPTGGSATLSHHTSKLKSGNYFVVRESASSARVEELDAQKQVVWSWDLYQDGNISNGGVNDWCHLNSVRTDSTEQFVYFNCRFQGLFKVDKSSKSIVWHMGAGIDDMETGDVTYKPDNSARFNDAHDPEVHADGTALFYDNQGWANRTVGDQNGNFHTRIVEYTLDEAAQEATLSWSFPGAFSTDAWYTESWSTPIWGDANRLENGNVLVTAGVTGGNNGGMTPAGTKTRLFEVTREGEVVWALEWPSEVGSYRATRVELPVHPLAP